jgi:rhodanese-related sulfurtransferase
MSTGNSPGVTEVLPGEAWEQLVLLPDSVLVDVRTRAEWTYVGLPDLSETGRSPLLVEWAVFPEMSPNPRFADQLLEELGDTIPSKIFFLCRSGVRSLRAADAMATVFAAKDQNVDCINIAGGFEGDLDPHEHRGALNGWKARGLPWRQS